MTPKLGSLFDGSGGFPLAGTHYNIEPRWASEVEPYPIAVTRSRFPDMKHLGDISKINGAEIEPVDIITFGSPCQGLSVAGLRKGLEDERSGLFLQAIRIIKEMRKATNGRYPRFVLWENVPGALSSGTPKGEDFRIVLEELVKIVEPTAEMPPCDKGGWPYADSYVGSGWSLSYRIFDAQHFGKAIRDGDSGTLLVRGTPQRRRRIHLVLDLRGERAHEILFKPEGLRRNPPQSGAPWEGAARNAENSIGAADREGIGLDIYNLAVTGEKAASLTTATGQGASNTGPSVMQPIAYSFDSLASNSMKSSNPHSGCRQVEVAKCLDTTDPNPSKNQGGIAIVQKQYLFENHSQDARYKGPLDVCPMLPAQLGTGGNNTPFVVEADVIPINDKATRYKGGGSTRNQDGSGNGLGVGQIGDPSPTLTAGDRHAIAYAEGVIAVDQGGGKSGANYYFDVSPTLTCTHGGEPEVAFQTYQKVSGPLMANSHPGSYTGQDAYNDMLVAGVDCRNATEYPEMNGTLQAKANGGFSYNCNQVVRVRHIVRRLTPTECARLQGFPDKWGHPDHKDDFSDEEYKFWLDVRNTHAAINGKAVKDYTKAQMLTWYNKLHTDSAEFKMWGNGIALPPALYCMSGIAAALEAEDKATPEPAPRPAEEKKRVRLVAVRRIRK